MRTKKNNLFVVTYLLTCSIFTYGQTVLNADGPGNTYELINSVLAPGYNVIETPDIIHNDFGRHITEVFDSELNKFVFDFFIHLTPDNDISTLKTDRQRNEIKTYASSPANLKGTLGEIVRYKWRFKIPIGFQPSSTFTHIHQIKAVDGDDADPIFTLTPRKGTPNKLELIYVKDEFSGTDKKVIVNLSLFEGNWVEATETITIGPNGTYAIIIKKISDNAVILSYTNNNIATIRPDNSFIRPKWGIYRSIATPADLRDESIRFSDFSIEELSVLSVNGFENTLKSLTVFPNPVENNLSFTETIVNSFKHYKIIDTSGKTITSEKIKTNNIDVSHLKTGNYFIQLYHENKIAKTIQFLKK
ncbi:T9SS type A sorting domain-containing protein [Flavobacterium faecale]|uniref:T9SS type A sorting domain-containing protein n=1 Tax=Flavobacterium faecale TaxID=1355330 RepID=UPI003AAC2632